MPAWWSPPPTGATVKSYVSMGLELDAAFPYCHRMEDRPHHARPPIEWLEALAESEADLAAGRVVPGEVVMRELRESLVRLETKAVARNARKVTHGR